MLDDSGAEKTLLEDEELKPKKVRAKLLQFCENQRPPYWGTWGKRSKLVGPRRPFGQDKERFDYEYDSDDDWEEEPAEGESLSDEEKDKEDEEEAEIPEPEGILAKMMSGEGGSQYQAGSITITPKAPLNIPKNEASPNRTFICPKCPKLFTNKKEFDNHVLVHNSGMKKYACPVCGLRFHLLHNMKRHLLNHEKSGDIETGTTDELLEAAETTAAKFPQSGGAETKVMVNSAGHMKCNLCNKWFSEQIALQRHMEVHSDDRPFSCPICQWRFKQLHNMKRHLLTHSGAKPFSCDFCDKSYTDNYSLKQHVAKIHPDIASSLPHMIITPRNKAGKLGTAKRVGH